MEAAYFRFAADKDSVHDKLKFSAPFILITVSSLVFSLGIVLLRAWLGGAANPHHTESVATMNLVIELCAAILFFDTMTILPFCSLRLQHKAVRFATIRLTYIFLQVVLNLYFVVILHAGIAGIFWGNAISSAVTFFMLTPTIAKLFSFVFSKKIIVEFLQFGLPYVPSSLSTMVLQVFDRPILQRLTDDPTVGIYQANYRLGTIMMVFVSMFEFGWRPFFLQYASQPDAKRLFSRVLTYFSLIAAGIFLVVSFFVGDIARMNIYGNHTIIDSRYWSGLSIVPIVLAAYIFNGFYTNMIVGIYIEKRTKLLPLITGAAAASNIVGNIILIPLFGIAGAAWATFISYALMAFMIFRATQPFYPMDYEWGRIVKIGAVTLSTYVISLAIQQFVRGTAMEAINIVLLALVGVTFFVMKFFSAGEMGVLQTMFKGFGVRQKK